MLKVKAAKGVRVPVENRPHHYIEQEAVDLNSISLLKCQDISYIRISLGIKLKHLGS